MSIEIRVRLQETEADALLRAYQEGRSGWHANPSLALQRADFKIAGSIFRSRAEQESE